MCDGELHCSDASDEEACDYPKPGHYYFPLPPATIEFKPQFKFTHVYVGYKVIKTGTHLGSHVCPHTHFQCSEDGFCLPVFTRCNHVKDCPHGLDEEACDSLNCPGFLRCRASKVCLHMDHVCDGIFHCPKHDDEVFCTLHCPHNCNCWGQAFVCNVLFSASDFPYLRYLDASESSMSSDLLVNNTMLVHLSLAKCGLKSVSNVILPNLHSVDLSDNLIVFINVEVFRSWRNLRTLRLAGNPLETSILRGAPDFVLGTLTALDLSRVQIEIFSASHLKLFKNLQLLNLSSSAIRILAEPLAYLKRIRVLDVSNCHITTYPLNLFEDMPSLRNIYSEVFTLCCSAILPKGFDIKKCISPKNIMSSCTNIVGWNIGHLTLSTMAVFSSAGSFGFAFSHCILRRTSMTSDEDAVIVHMAVSDLLMGIFLSIIRVKDLLYKGHYFWYDITWRNSHICKLSGFLSFVSSTVSPMIITVITLQCCVSLYYGFVSLTCRVRATHLACVTAWLVGVVLATVPLLPVASHWRLYSQSALCLPTPVSTTQSAGQDYVVAVLVVLRLTLAVLMCVAHVLTYHRLVNYSITADDPVGTAPALSRARRLFWMTLCHCLSLLSFAVMEILASRGDTVTMQGRAAITIILLPCGAALDPVLYILGVLREQRQNDLKDRILKQLKSVIARKCLQMHKA